MPEWEVDWQNVHADSLDDFSPFMMFRNQDENFQEIPEWGWDPTPNEYQLQAENDPLDTFSLPMLFAEEYQSQAVICNWSELACYQSNLSYFNDLILNDPYNNVGLAPYLEPPEFEEDVASNGFNSMDFLVEEAKSEASITSPEDVDVAMMNLWEDEPEVKASSWANTKIVNIKVGK